MNGPVKRLLALVPNVVGASPGQRVRIETWAEHLRKAGAGWQVDLLSFEDAGLRAVLYAPGHHLAKASGMVRCYLRQLGRVLRRPPCDLLLVYREAAIIGPAVIERLAARLGVPVVYDLDDPVFVAYRSPMNGWFSLLKVPSKSHSLFSLADHVIAINELIADYARKFNPSVSVVPNAVDVERYRPASGDVRRGSPLRLGWVGSHSTMSNLAEIAGPLGRVQTECGAEIVTIGAGQVALPGLRVESREWSAATEVADLQSCDVGLAPVPASPWSKWKFFYKVIQYMAIGLPVVATRTGSNHEIIDDGVNGFLVDGAEDWHRCLLALASDPQLRRRVGAAARATVVERFSTARQLPRVAEILEGVLRRGRRAKVSAADEKMSAPSPRPQANEDDLTGRTC